MTVGGDGMANIIINNDESDGVLAIHVNVSTFNWFINQDNISLKCTFYFQAKL